MYEIYHFSPKIPSYASHGMSTDLGNQGTFALEASRPLANLHHVPGPGKIPNESSTTTATLWFCGFWASLAPHLVEKIHHPWLLSSPNISGQTRKSTTKKQPHLRNSMAFCHTHRIHGTGIFNWLENHATQPNVVELLRMLLKMLGLKITNHHLSFFNGIFANPGSFLVGGFEPTPLKHMLVKNGLIFPNFRGEH